MLASSITDIRKAFDDKGLATTFAQRFLEAYTATAFGVLPKTEIDLLVFTLLVQAKVIDPNGSMFRTARALNITPAKARSLLFQYQLRHVSQAQTDHEVMIAITTARYWKDNGRLSFGVGSPLVIAAISAKMQDAGVFADISLSGDILRVHPTHFGSVLWTLLPKSAADRLIAHLHKTKALDENDAKRAFDTYASRVAAAFVEHGEKLGLDKFVEVVSDVAKEHGHEAIDVLAGFLE